jgi:hypothetical protein
LRRASLSNPLVVGEECHAIESLKEPWRRTRVSAWPIVGCFVIVVLLLALAMVSFDRILCTPGVEGSVIEALTGNGLGAVFCVILAVLSTAIYGLIAKSEGALDDVFS